jgi:ATP-binding cassette, subfamily C (CFTR/MRP), member 1
MDCIVFVVLSFMEHQKSVGPPLLLNSYLLISILFDAVRIRTMWVSQVESSVAILFTTGMAVKTMLLLLEECGK